MDFILINFDFSQKKCILFTQAKIPYLSTKLQKINELKSGTFFGLLDQPARTQNVVVLFTVIVSVDLTGASQ